MAKPQPYSKIRPGIEHGRSMSFAVANSEEAKKRNQEFKEMGIAAHYEIKPNGQIAPLVYESRQGRRDAVKAMGFDPEDHNQ
jgi:hypothetical protein